MKTVFFFLLLGANLWASTLFAQDLSGIDELGFQQRVKQLDEFFSRFNYTHDIGGKRVTMDTLMRKKYVLSLFDRNYLQKASADRRTMVMRFVESLIDSSKQIAFTDADWYAETLCQVKYKGKVQKMTVILKTEQDSSGNQRWAIASVKMPFLDLQAKDSTKFITPVSHELNFMQLSEITNKEKDNITAFAAKGTNMNPLSVFFYLVKNGELQISFVEKITYHFLQVPNYIFTVEHFERSGGNVGWLISSLQVATVAQKQIYKQF